MKRKEQIKNWIFTILYSVNTLLFFQGTTILAQDSLELEPSTTQDDQYEFQKEANMRGFLNWILAQPEIKPDLQHDANTALSVLAAQSAKLSGYTDLEDPSDATSLENMKEACKTLARTNELRAYESKLEGVEISPLMVSLELIAIAQKQLNWSDTNMNHAQVYFVGENLAWGHEDPVGSWYFSEREQAKNGATQGIGHYQNVVNSSYQSTGAAHNKNNLDYGQGQCDNQVYLVTPGLLSVEEYTDLVLQYEIFLKNGNSLPGITSPQNPQDPITEENPGQSNTPPEKDDQNLTWKLEEIPQDYHPLWRFYNLETGEHFYTAIEEERLALIEMRQWQAEGVGWIAPKLSTTPVYRVYNANSDDHHYTTDANERDVLVRLGWLDEGVGWYSDSLGTVPVYRQYNPNALFSGAHNYTVYQEEKEALISYGWLDEEIGWYASAMAKME